MPGLLVHQLRHELRFFWRNPGSVAFTFALPLLLLVVLATVNSGSTAYLVELFPGMLAFGVVATCYTNLAITLSIWRDLGILRRLQASPLSASIFVAGRMLAAATVALLLSTVTLLVGVLLYGIEVHVERLGALAATLVLGAGCLSALALAITPFIPNSQTGPAVINFTVWPLVLISGIVLSRPDGWLGTLADVFPLRPLAQMLSSAFVGPDGSSTPFAWSDVLVLLAWGLGGVVIAVRCFRMDVTRN